MALCAALLLAGCVATGTEAPVYLTPDLPPIPAECTAPSRREPKLPDQDIDDLAAAKDRLALKNAFRGERHLRRVCAERLKVVLPANGKAAGN